MGLRDESGQGTVEWAALVLVVAIVLGAAGTAVDASWLPARLRCAIAGTACASGPVAPAGDAPGAPRALRAAGDPDRLLPATIEEVPDPGAQAFTAAAVRQGAGCRRVQHTYVAKSLLGLSLFSFQLEERFCWDGRRVTRVFGVTSRANVHPIAKTVWHSVRDTLPAGSYFYRYDGHENGGHWTVRTHRFSACLPKAGCPLEFDIEIDLRVHYDGTDTSSHARH